MKLKGGKDRKEKQIDLDEIQKQKYICRDKK